MMLMVMMVVMMILVFLPVVFGGLGRCLRLVQGSGPSLGICSVYSEQSFS